MADHVHWIGPMETLYDPDDVVVGSMPAQYLQYRDADGTVHNVPAGDMDEATYAALPAEAKALVLASGWYELQP